MLNSELSAAQEGKLHSILDIGIESFQKSSTLTTAQLEPPLKATAQVPVYKLQDEMSSLQDKISSLEWRLKSSSHYNVPRGASHSPGILKSIEVSEKELQVIERSIASPSRNRPSSIRKELDRLKKELVKERRSANELKKDGESLRKKANNSKSLQGKLDGLMADYQSLAKSFERSEHIRSKQKQIIEDLKTELLSVIPPERQQPKRARGKKALRQFK